jgi:hypothetical protein
MALTLDGSVTVATPEYIELDLLVFTSLPIDATPNSFQKATTMIEQHGFMDIHRDLIARADDDVQRTYQSMAAELARLEPDGNDPCVPGVRCKERAKGRGIAVAVHALDNPCTFLPCR